jgi:hypothetical protein
MIARQGGRRVLTRRPAASGARLTLRETLSERWDWNPTQELAGKAVWCELFTVR